MKENENELHTMIGSLLLNFLLNKPLLAAAISDNEYRRPARRLTVYREAKPSRVTLKYRGQFQPRTLFSAVPSRQRGLFYFILFFNYLINYSCLPQRTLSR